MNPVLLAYLPHRGLRRERRFKDHLDPLHHSSEDLLRHYRFPRHEILELCEELERFIGRPTQRSHAIPVHTQVLMSLRFYASGTFQNVIGDVAGVTQGTVSKVIGQVTDVLHEKAKREIKMPTHEEINQTVQNFFAISGFPKVIGAIDGTHIPIKAPSEEEHLFINRKGYYSLNVQVVCNSDNLITSTSIKYPGSTHDSFIWNNSFLRDRFEAGEFQDTYLLGKHYPG